jgi:hypothetical protein
MESHVENDALLVAISFLEKRTHNRQNQMSRDGHELQP